MVELERRLHDLGSAVDWPSHDIATKVTDRLGVETEPVRVTHRRNWRAAAAVAAAIAVGAAAVPASRAAIGDWLGVRGERIEVSATTVPTTTAHDTTPPDLQLGPEVALADVRAQVGFTMPVPRVPGFDHPDEVHVARVPASGEATLLYRTRPDLPPAGPSGVGMLISAFRADIEGALFTKVVTPGVHLEQVTVQGGVGYWIEGDLHEFFYRDASGRIVPHTLRLAANVLLWEVNGVTVRIESALSRDEVIRVADAMA